MEFLETMHIVLAVIFAVIVVLALACSVYFGIFEKKDSKTGKTSGGGFWKFILSILIVIVSFALFGMCSRVGGRWEPRHTQVIEIKKSNSYAANYADSYASIN